MEAQNVPTLLVAEGGWDWGLAGLTVILGFSAEQSCEVASAKSY